MPSTIWQPGPWGEDFGRFATDEEVAAMRARQRPQKATPLAAPPELEPETDQPKVGRRRRSEA